MLVALNALGGLVAYFAHYAGALERACEGQPSATVTAAKVGGLVGTVVGVLVGPLAVAVHDRYVEEERVDW